MERKDQEDKPTDHAQRDAGKEIKKPDFSGFITGLYMQTLLAMGVMEDPNSGGKEVDLGETQFLIDTLGMLEKKTSGNLTENESRYLHQVLNDLRMRYVQAARHESGEGADGGENDHEKNQ